MKRTRAAELPDLHEVETLGAGQQMRQRRGRTVQAADADRLAKSIAPLIDAIRSTGISTLAGIAEARNARGVRTAMGGQWHVASVQNVLGRI